MISTPSCIYQTLYQNCLLYEYMHFKFNIVYCVHDIRLFYRIVIIFLLFILSNVCNMLRLMKQATFIVIIGERAICLGSIDWEGLESWVLFVSVLLDNWQRQLFDWKTYNSTRKVSMVWDMSTRILQIKHSNLASNLLICGIN